MPRVSEEHLERRRQQILDAAQLCFGRKGFHETSMQDVFAESGLSAGAVYRYFKSKNDIVQALATQTMGQLRAKLVDAIATDPLPTPADLVHFMATEVVQHSGPEGRIRLAPQVWAMAMVNQDTAQYVRQAMLTMRTLWADYAVRMRDQGWLPADTDIDAVAATLISLLPGFMLQHLIVGDPDPEAYARGVRTLLPFGERVTT